MYSLNGIQLRQSLRNPIRLILTEIGDSNNFYRKSIFLRAFLESIFNLYRIKIYSLNITPEHNRLNITVVYLPIRSTSTFFKSKAFQRDRFSSKFLKYLKVLKAYKFVKKKGKLKEFTTKHNKVFSVLNWSKKHINVGLIKKNVTLLNDVTPYSMASKKYLRRYNRIKKKVVYKKKKHPLYFTLNRTVKFNSLFRKLSLRSNTMRLKVKVKSNFKLKWVFRRMGLFFIKSLFKKNTNLLWRANFVRQLIEFHCIFFPRWSNLNKKFFLQNLYSKKIKNATHKYNRFFIFRRNIWRLVLVSIIKKFKFNNYSFQSSSFNWLMGKMKLLLINTYPINKFNLLFAANSNLKSMVHSYSFKKSKIVKTNFKKFVMLKEWLIERKKFNFSWTKVLALRYNMELFLMSATKLPIYFNNFDLLSSMKFRYYDLAEATNQFFFNVKKQGLKYNFLQLSSLNICLAAFLSDPTILFVRFVDDLKRLNYTSQINAYLNKYLILALTYYGTLNLDVLVTFVEMAGKLGYSDRSVISYSPELSKLKPVKTKTIGVRVFSKSAELKTTKGVVSFSLFVYYGFNN